MKNIVLKDVNPNKLKSLKIFLKEMNDFVGLVTNYGAPAVSYADIHENELNSDVGFEWKEGNYKVVLDANINDDIPVRVDFMIYENKKCLFQAKYTIRDTPYYALQVILNCDSEAIIREELIKRFERDFSAEAHENMGKSLEELREKKEKIREEIEKPKNAEDKPDKETHVFEENEALIKGMTKKEVQDAQEEEVALELEQLSEKILEGIKDASQIIAILNDIAHDLTRGACGSFKEVPINEQFLENGATVQMIDLENNGYSITYRKGILDEDAEISFFLERANDLIFSVYLSTEGYGKISAEGKNGEHVIQQVNVRLNA